MIMLLAQLLGRADGGSHRAKTACFMAPEMLFWLSPSIFKALCGPAGLAFPCSLYESYYLGVVGPGFLNQVPTLSSSD